LKAEILKILKEAKGYVSGQELCERFGVSRTAVWKVIRQLQEEGYKVEAVRNRGYCIVDNPDILSVEEVQSLMDVRWIGRQLYYYPQIDSTNIKAKQLGETDARHGTLVMAGSQAAGRGRRGKSWESPFDENIYMSLLLRPDFAPAKASMLTLVMAYSVARTLRELEHAEVQIKWPNDIVLNGKKLVGILTEMSTEIDYINYVVIGIGINVNQESFSGELVHATSLYRETGQKVHRAFLITAVMKRFEEDYEQFVREESLSWIKDAYNELLVNYQREVMIHKTDGSYQAFAMGINDKGELLVRREDGTEESIFAGEVSVRGIYGYV